VSGDRELHLRSETLEVTILPDLGGRLHRIRAFGVDLLRTPADPSLHATEPVSWGAYPMAPWCNRAPTGRRVVAGRTLDLRQNFGDGTAIHGLVFERAWDLASDGSLSITGGGRGEPWPWEYEVRLDPALERERLELRLGLRNRSDDPMPAGIGLHPWFLKPLAVSIGAAQAYASNIGSPSEPMPVDGAHDLRRLGEPSDGLDATWTALETGTIELAWRDVGIGASLEAATNGPSPLVALASPASLDAVAIEPQTHGPDPFRRLERGEPDAPFLLPPGAELTLSLRLTVFRAQDASPAAG
jgi:aldose 1-epimerase